LHGICRLQGSQCRLGWRAFYSDHFMERNAIDGPLGYKQGVTRPDGQHWQLEGLSVHDGSLFPTSIGANPQLSIYGLVNRLTAGLIGRLGAVA
jgi:GMC oxidoreductase